MRWIIKYFDTDLNEEIQYPFKFSERERAELEITLLEDSDKETMKSLYLTHPPRKDFKIICKEDLTVKAKASR